MSRKDSIANPDFGWPSGIPREGRMEKSMKKRYNEVLLSAEVIFTNWMIDQSNKRLQDVIGIDSVWRLAIKRPDPTHQAISTSNQDFALRAFYCRKRSVLGMIE